MREYLIRAGIIGTTNSTFGLSSTDGFVRARDQHHKQNGPIKSPLGETHNAILTVRI